MFGLVRPCLKNQDKSEYKCYYCGLCMGMGRCTGFLSRILINYDVCIAYLVADSIYTDTPIKKTVCPFSLIKIVKYRDNPQLLDHMAEVNYILTYHKVLDDVLDNNSFKAKAVERVMRKRYSGIAAKYEHTINTVAEKMRVIHEMETQDRFIDILSASTPFGELLESIMSDCLEDPIDSKVFATLCKHLGMWIYIIDACVDLSKDAKSKKYNPILAGSDGPFETIFSKRKEEISTFLMDRKQAMQQLLQLLSSAKNKELVDTIFEYILPREVAEMLQ